MTLSSGPCSRYTETNTGPQTGVIRNKQVSSDKWKKAIQTMTISSLMRSLTRYQVIISVIFIKTSASIYLCDVGVFVSISALIPSRVIKGQLNPAMNQMQLWAKFFTTSQYSFSQTLSLIHLLALSLARNVSFFSTFCLDHNTMWVAA